MTKKELFAKKNRDLLCIYSFEYLSMLLGKLNYSAEEYDNSKTREDVLSTLKILFELGVLSVYKWLTKPELNEINLTIEEMIHHIDEIWYKGAEYPDFYEMMIFGPENWYEEELKKLGLSETTDWDWFLDAKIDNLEKWIEENRPKN